MLCSGGLFVVGLGAELGLASGDDLGLLPEAESARLVVL
jgi:hypothetical protein